jgi:hypothetical protein
MDKSVKISAARARLFDLVDEVTGAEAGVVLIEHRDRAERAALVSERYLRYLQTTIAELRRYGGPTFRLAGSARLLAPAEEVAAALGERPSTPAAEVPPAPVPPAPAAEGAPEPVPVPAAPGGAER